MPKETKEKKITYSPEELAKAVEANKGIYNDYFSLHFVKQINEQIFNIFEKIYFRPVFIGFDELPKRNNPDAPVILASNHSGMAFPWDAMVFGCGLYRRHGYDDPEKQLRVMVAPALSASPIMHPYLMKDAWKLAGGIDATYLNFETMMQLQQGNVLIYPEGVPGIGKGFNRRYQLQRLATSFIRMSLKYKTDIVSYSTINAEYVAPLMYSVDGVNRFMNKLGVPFLSLGPLTLFLLFPFAFYLSLPAKMHFVMGRRISPYQWTDKPYEELTEEDVQEIRDKVKKMMQEDLDEALKKYGGSPYRILEFFKQFFLNIHRFPFSTPLGWMLLFHDFERQWWHRGGKDGKPIKVPSQYGIFSMIWLMLRNPITFAYFIPIVGWVILVIYGNWKWKKYRK